MKFPDIIYFFRPPVTKDQAAPAPLVEAAGHGMLVSTQSLPTHLATVRWAAEGFEPRWLVLLRADDSATIIARSANAAHDFDPVAALCALHAVRLPVLAGCVDIGNPHLALPRSIKGVYPGEKQFAALLAEPDFVRWLKQFIDGTQ